MGQHRTTRALWSLPKRATFFASTVMSMVLAVGMLASPIAEAAPATNTATAVAETSISPSTQTNQTGNSFTYSIAVSCESVKSSCVSSSETTPVTVSIPLPTSPDMASWKFAASSSPSALLASGPTLNSTDTDLTMTLNSADFAGGDSGTISLQVTPPTNTTPDDTTWSFTPTISGGTTTSSYTAPSAAEATATATPRPVVAKYTSDGGSVYAVGATVPYTIQAYCNVNDPGNLYMEDNGTATLVDQLPSSLTYVSSSPSTGVYDATNNTVTWTFGTATGDAALPSGCASGATGTNSYSVSTTVAAGTETTIKNTATFQGYGATASGGTVQGTTNTNVTVDAVQTPPTSPGTGYPSISKSARAPLSVGGSGNDYVGTYPGDWSAISDTPSYTVGQAPASYQVNISMPEVSTYEVNVVDPVPCLSGDPTGAQDSLPSGEGDAEEACPNGVAFHTEYVEVYAPNLATAVDSGWAPIETGVTPLTKVSSSGDTYYYKTTSDDASEIDLPASTYLSGNSIQMTLYGWASSQLQAGATLVNTATAMPYLESDTSESLATISSTATIYIMPANYQLGISKSFGSPRGGPGGTTVVNLKGAVSVPTGLSSTEQYPVVLTDLLPSGMTWSNAESGTVSGFTLQDGSDAATSVSATVDDLADYGGTGRQLIRVTFPASDFTTAGNWIITPPTNFIEVTSPIGTYTNTAQVFLYGVGNTNPPVVDSCSTPTQIYGGTSSAVYESDDPDNLAGDGLTQEPYCQNQATLTISPTGGAFSLATTVQGNVSSKAGDPPAGPLGVAYASMPDGTGTYDITWTNEGNDTLDDATIYDILPYVGDTGVSGGESDIQRGSQWATEFASASSSSSDVTIYYSTATNPCRPQVGVSSGCTADSFSTTEPSNPATVTALEFVSSASYTQNQNFTMTINVNVPDETSIANEIAWNSAAAYAADVSSPSTTLLPTEPPEVGLVAVNGTSIPSSNILSTGTTVASTNAYSGTAIHDRVTIIGTPSPSNDTLNWSFVGPVATTSGACPGPSSSEWTGTVNTVASGSIIGPALDTALTTGPANVQAIGCYSWEDTLTNTSSGALVASSLPGQSSETVLAEPNTPTLSSAASATPGSTSTVGATTSDSLTISNSGFPSDGSVTATVAWQLVGPVPVSSTTELCPASSDTAWSTASTVSAGTISVDGNGTYPTPSTGSVSIPATDGPGCYSYADTLEANTSSGQVVLPAGNTAETFQVVSPSIVKTVTSPVIAPNTTTGTTADSFTLTPSVPSANSIEPGQTVTVTDTLPTHTGLTYTQDSYTGVFDSTNCPTSGGVLTCTYTNNGSTPVTSLGTVTIGFTESNAIATTYQVSNTATVAYGTGAPVNSNTVTVTFYPSVTPKIAKSVTNPVVAPNTTLGYSDDDFVLTPSLPSGSSIEPGQTLTVTDTLPTNNNLSYSGDSYSGVFDGQICSTTSDVLTCTYTNGGTTAVTDLGAITINFIELNSATTTYQVSNTASVAYNGGAVANSNTVTVTFYPSVTPKIAKSVTNPVIAPSLSSTTTDDSFVLAPSVPSGSSIEPGQQLTVTDVLPTHTGLAYTTDSYTGVFNSKDCSTTGGTLICTYTNTGTTAVTSFGTITINFTESGSVSTTYTVSNTASVAYNGGTATNSNTVEVVYYPPVTPAIVKTATHPLVGPSSTSGYSNDSFVLAPSIPKGSSIEPGQTLTVTDTLPTHAGLSYTTDSYTGVFNSTDCSTTSGVLTCTYTNNGTTAVASLGTITIGFVELNAVTTSYTVSNTANVTYDTGTPVNSNTVTVTYYPSITPAIVKTVDVPTVRPRTTQGVTPDYFYVVPSLPGGGTVEPGQTIVVTDPLPTHKGVTYTTDSYTGVFNSSECVTANNVLTCTYTNAGTTGVSNLGTITINFTELNSIPTSYTISSIAAISYDGGTPVPSNTVSVTFYPVIAPVRLVTGPPVAPSHSNEAFPIGVGIGALGAAVLSLVLLKRKHRPDAA